MRVVLDTSVLVRATGNSRGPAGEVFLRLLEPPHTLIVSQFLLDELRRALNYPRVQTALGLTPEMADEHVRDVAAAAELIDLPPRLHAAVPSDPNDNPIVATAVLGRSEVLSTHDRDLRRTEVIEYCRQFQARVITDLDLLGELRQLDRDEAE